MRYEGELGAPPIAPFAGEASGYREDRYSPAATAAVYQELLRQSEHWVGMGQSVVLDASWTDNSWRDAARAVADRTHSDLGEFQCQADPQVAADRIARRLEGHADISEATPEIGRAMSRSADAWPSATSVDTVALAPDQAVTQVLEMLARGRGDIAQ